MSTALPVRKTLRFTMRRNSRFSTLAAGVLIALVWSCPAFAYLSINSGFQLYAGSENPFQGLNVPPRQTLLRASPFYGSRVGAQSCLADLADLRRGFQAIYPEIKWVGKELDWTIHIAMVFFPDLVVCAHKDELLENLAEIRHRHLSFERVPQSIEMDARNLKLPPYAISRTEHILIDFAWMAAQGYVPAMVELVKLSSRDDLIRLTPRYNYYLLSVIKDAGQLDDTCARLLRHAEQLLPPDDRATIDTRVETRSWPDDERMVID